MRTTRQAQAHLRSLSALYLRAAGFLLTGLAGLLAVQACHAQLALDVSLDTSGLQSSTEGPFSVDLQFIDGSGLGDGNNTTLVNLFQFGAGGAPVGDPTLLGDASGDVVTGVSMDDAVPFNEFTQPFTPGDALRFRVNLTTLPDDPTTPCDQFAFAILNGLTAIPTTLPGNNLMTVDVCSGTVMASGAAGTSIVLSAPSVQAVPEPGWPAFLIGAFAVAACVWRPWRAGPWRRGAEDAPVGSDTKQAWG